MQPAHALWLRARSERTRRVNIAQRSNPSAVDPAHAQVLDDQEILDPVFRAFAAEARFLDASERRDLGGDDAGVDADDAVLERLGDPPDAADVASVEVRRQ